MQLGLLGGSFNPIHYGHLGIALQAYERLHLDRVLFVPTGDPPHKPDGTLAPAIARYEMVRLAIADNPAFSISDIEVTRMGKSYSIDTVRELQRQYGSSTHLFFLIGLDAFMEFPTWKDPQALLESCHFVVVSRPGQSFQSLAELSLLPKINPQELAQLDSGHTAKLEVPIPSGPGLICLLFPPCPTSASDIRQRIQR